MLSVRFFWLCGSFLSRETKSFGYFPEVPVTKIRVLAPAPYKNPTVKFAMLMILRIFVPRKVVKRIPEMEVSDRWVFTKDPIHRSPRTPRILILSTDTSLSNIRKFQISNRFALLKHLADCEKGEKGRDLPKGHLTTAEGEDAFFSNHLPTTQNEKAVD